MSYCLIARDHPLHGPYHDREYGFPIEDDNALFERLMLEINQAGLSWATILKKRDAYRRAFAGFDASKVARFDGRKMERLLQDPGIVRNRAKVESAVANAREVLVVQEEFGSLGDYLWSFVGGTTIRNRWTSLREIPAETPESTEMSKALKKRGFRFVGPTICYAFMQAAGLVNDHEMTCFRYREVGR